MRFEPAIDKKALLRTLRQACGLAVDRLRFVATEWQAYCYVVECIGGERYFLKLHDDSGQTPFAASCRDFYVPLMYELHAKDILPHVPHPLMTQDEQLVIDSGEYSLLLSNYIDGEVVGQDGMTATILAKLATLLGRLHRSTSQITVPKPFVETFEVRFEAEMVRTCDMLVDGVPDEDKGKRRLQESLLPRKGELLVHLGRLKELQQRVKRIEHTMVICHTDLHGENLMMDHQGHLHILDWENAILAPAEHDLMFLAGHESFWESFLPIYEREIGSARLNSDVLGFYYYRRDLEDLMDWIVRIMDSGGDEAQNAAGFREMVDCLDGLSEIEQKVRRIREEWRKYGGK